MEDFAVNIETPQSNETGMAPPPETTTNTPVVEVVPQTSSSDIKSTFVRTDAQSAEFWIEIQSFYREGLYTDLTILSGEERTPLSCHRLVVGAVSKLLRPSLDQNLITVDSLVVHLPDYTHEGTRSFVDSLYAFLAREADEIDAGGVDDVLKSFLTDPDAFKFDKETPVTISVKCEVPWDDSENGVNGHANNHKSNGVKRRNNHRVKKEELGSDDPDWSIEDEYYVDDADGPRKKRRKRTAKKTLPEELKEFIDDNSSYDENGSEDDAEEDEEDEGDEENEDLTSGEPKKRRGRKKGSKMANHCKSDLNKEQLYDLMKVGFGQISVSVLKAAFSDTHCTSLYRNKLNYQVSTC